MNSDERRALVFACISCGITPDMEALSEVPIPSRHMAGLSTRPWFCCRCLRDIELFFIRSEEKEKAYRIADYEKRMENPGA